MDIITGRSRGWRGDACAAAWLLLTLAHVYFPPAGETASKVLATAAATAVGAAAWFYGRRLEAAK